MYNGHLSIEELEELSQQKGPAENQSHLENCQRCRELLAKCRTIDAKLQKLASVRIGSRNGMRCPGPRVWFDVAAGLVSSEEDLAYIQHAADCDTCGPRLRAAARLFAEDSTPEVEKAISALPSSREENRREIAEGLSTLRNKAQQQTSNESVREPLPWWMQFLRPAYAFPVLVILVVAIVSTPELIGAYHQKKAKDSVRNAYLQDRRMPYRPAVAPYGQDHSEMGESSLLSPISIPDSKKEPCLAAEAELWEGNYDTAIAVLTATRKSGNDSAQVLNDLVVAYARRWNYTSDESSYLKALEISNQIVQQYPQDATVRFNRAILYQEHGDLGRACGELHRLAQLDPSSLWTKEAENKLACPK